eukprot:366298-Chlamydomonas_euryale.AAC.16
METSKGSRDSDCANRRERMHARRSTSVAAGAQSYQRDTTTIHGHERGSKKRRRCNEHSAVHAGCMAWSGPGVTPGGAEPLMHGVERPGGHTWWGRTPDAWRGAARGSHLVGPNP